MNEKLQYHVLERLRLCIARCAELSNSLNIGTIREDVRRETLAMLWIAKTELQGAIDLIALDVTESPDEV